MIFWRWWNFGIFYIVQTFAITSKLPHQTSVDSSALSLFPSQDWANLQLINYKFSILKTVPIAINVMFILPSTYIYKHFQELLVAGILIFCRLWYKCIFKVIIITIHLESHGQINSYYHDNCHNLHLEINAITRFFSHECFLYKTGHMSVMSLSKLTIYIACISRI